MAVRTADVVKALKGRVEILVHQVEVLHLVHDAERPAFLAGAVVRTENDKGVVEPPELTQEADQPADLGVGMIEHRRERLLQARGEALLLRAQL